MATYTESKNALDEIAATVAGGQAKFNNFGNVMTNAIASLNAIPTDNSDVISTLNTYAGADPAWLNLVAEKNNMVADFVSLRNDFTALQTAYNAI